MPLKFILSLLLILPTSIFPTTYTHTTLYLDDDEYNTPLSHIRLFQTHYSNDYFSYQQPKVFDAQRNGAYCGIATVSTIFNSLAQFQNATFLYQEDLLEMNCSKQNVIQGPNGFFTPPYGISLSQVERLLNCVFTRGWDVTKVHVNPNEMTLEDVRNELKEALRDANTRVLVNFDRREIGQDGGGHFSPLGSYHPPSDSFLIVDTARNKYPPVWVKAKALYRALGTIDDCGQWDYPTAQFRLPDDWEEWNLVWNILGCEKRFRGYIVVRKLLQHRDDENVDEGYDG